MKRSVFIFLSLFYLIVPQEVWAKTWYVRPVTSKMERPWNGTSKEHAFNGLAMIIWGEAGVKAGDTLILCRKETDPERFSRTLIIKASGIPGNPITIESEDPNNPAIIISEKQINYPGIPGYDPSKVKTTGNTAIATQLNAITQYIIIRNIIIESCYGCFFYNLFHSTIQNIDCKNIYSGISIFGGSNVTIEFCDIDTMWNYGLGLFGTDPKSTTPLNNCIIRNNRCSNSIDEDGITLHASNDGNRYNLGVNNRVINNICNNNHEEGLDITSGSDILVEGNETYNNGSSAVMWHVVKNVVFTRNYSHNESGLLIGPDITNVTVAYNVFDTKAATSCLIIYPGREHKIYNNLFKSANVSKNPSVVDINGAKDVIFKNNIFWTTEPTGFLLQFHEGNSDTLNIKFDHNCWWHPLDLTVKAFYTRGELPYSFSTFKKYLNVTDSIFSDPQLSGDFAPSPSSPCIDTGDYISSDIYLQTDFKGNHTPINNRDIGAIETIIPAEPKNLRKLH